MDEEQTNKITVDNLPEEVLLKAFGYLDTKNMIQASEVCTK